MADKIHTGEQVKRTIVLADALNITPSEALEVLIWLQHDVPTPPSMQRHLDLQEAAARCSIRILGGAA